MASLLALAVAISWTLWKGKVLPEKVGTTKRVPVLPFENLSPDPDNAYFTEGIHEEILARLATIHDLKVISAIPRSATYSKLTRIRLRQVVHATVARVHPRSVLPGSKASLTRHNLGEGGNASNWAANFHVTSRRILRITLVNTQRRIETYEPSRQRNNNYNFFASPSLAWARCSIGRRDIARTHRNANPESKTKRLKSICVSHGFPRTP